MRRLAHDEALRAPAGRGRSDTARRARSTRRVVAARIEALYQDLRGASAPMTPAAARRRRRALGLPAARPRRARAPRLRPRALPRRRGLEVTLITAPPATPACPGGDAIHPRLHAPHRAVSHVPVGRPSRHDGDRSQHGVSALRPARRARRRCDLVATRQVDIVHGFGASVLGYARRRRHASAPLVLNPQGLEEFGATDPTRAPAEAGGLSAAAPGGARVRPRGRSGHRHRSRAEPAVLHHLACTPDRVVHRSRTRSTCDGSTVSPLTADGGARPPRGRHRRATIPCS